MKTIYAIAFFALLFTMVSCQNTGTAQGKINDKISVDEFDKQISANPNAQLIDVRTPEEFTNGHLKNAINIDVRSSNFEELIGHLDKSKPVYVYCLSGGRSGKAAGNMNEMGFAEVHNMDGGIMKWGSAGKTLEQGAGQPKSKSMTMDAFNKLVASPNYVLVDFNAKWCEPCKKMLPVLEALADKKKDKLTLLKIDADENKGLINEKRIAGIPYLELYQNGQLVWKHEGYIEEADLLKETKL